MNIFKYIRVKNCGEVCQNCVHFHNDPTHIEQSYNGLTAMSSGFASVRHRDGLCDHHDIYLATGDSCESFTPRSVEKVA